MSKIQEIVNKLKQAQETYYGSDKPIMSDTEYDLLEEELKILDPKNEYFQKIGSKKVSQKDKIKHENPMLSLDKAQTIQEVFDWLRKIGYDKLDTALLAEPKIDGVSCTVKYNNGLLNYIATRGEDGTEGQDITHIKDYITSIPKIVDSKFTGEIRGELVLYKKYNTLEINPNSTTLRNVVSGLINRKENFENLKYVNFVAYKSFHEDFYEEDRLKHIESLGFKIVPYFKVLLENEIEEIYNKYLSTLREEWEYKTDGLVLIINFTLFHEQINKNYIINKYEHHNLALKPPAESKESILKNIRWQVSRLGNVIAIAEIVPISIGGVVISNVTLNNYNNVIKLNLNIGDRLLIKRANDVIPYLEENLSATKDRELTTDINIIPKYCPSCNSLLIHEGVHLVCKNLECPEQQLQRIIYWLKRLNIEEISDKILRQLFDAKIITSIKELYEFINNKEKQNQALTLEGIGQKTIETLISQLITSKTMNIQKFISLLNIPLVQLKTVINLEINSVNQFLNFNDATFVAGRNLIKFVQENKVFIYELLEILEVKNMEEKNVGQMKGKVCLTGAWIKTREELMEILTNKGYEFTNSLTKDVIILVCDDINSNTTKMQKAKKANIKIVTYEEFFN